MLHFEQFLSSLTRPVLLLRLLAQRPRLLRGVEEHNRLAERDRGEEPEQGLLLQAGLGGGVGVGGHERGVLGHADKDLGKEQNHGILQ